MVYTETADSFNIWLSGNFPTSRGRSLLLLLSAVTEKRSRGFFGLKRVPENKFLLKNLPRNVLFDRFFLQEKARGKPLKSTIGRFAFIFKNSLDYQWIKRFKGEIFLICHQKDTAPPCVDFGNLVIGWREICPLSGSFMCTGLPAGNPKITSKYHLKPFPLR